MPQNQPLYLSTFAGDDMAARISTMVHCCLDAVEEKGAPLLLPSPLFPLPPHARAAPSPLPPTTLTPLLLAPPAGAAVAGGLRGTAPPPLPGDAPAPDAYLGVLAAEDELRVFGLITATRTKLMLVVDDAAGASGAGGPAAVVKDEEMRAVGEGRCGGWEGTSARTAAGACPGLNSLASNCVALPWSHPFLAHRTLSASPRPPPALLQIFRRMHAAYLDAVSNPFYQCGTPLASPRFDASIRTIVTSLGAGLA